MSCGQVLALVKVVRRDMRGCAGGVEGDLGSGIYLWRDRELIHLWGLLIAGVDCFPGWGGRQ